MPSTALYPVFLDLTHRPVLIVGGGAVGLRKARGLVMCGARATVVSLAFADGYGPDIERVAAPYAADFMALKPWRLVFAATDSPAVNAAIAQDARDAGILCCRADDADAGDFVNGAVERVGPITLAVNSGGSPALASRVARHAAAGIDPVLIRLAALSVPWRSRAKSHVANPAARRALLQRASSEEMESLVRTQGEAAAEQHFEQWLLAAITASRSPSLDDGGDDAQ